MINFGHGLAELAFLCKGSDFWGDVQMKIAFGVILLRNNIRVTI